MCIRYLLLNLYLYYAVCKLIQNFFQYKADNFKQAVVIIKHFMDFLKYLTKIHWLTIEQAQQTDINGL